MSLENLRDLAEDYEMNRHSQAYIAMMTQQTIRLIGDFDRLPMETGEEERRRRREQIKTLLFVVLEEIYAQYPQLARSHHDFLSVVV